MKRVPSVSPRAISLAVKREICSMPCVICGIPYFIKCDHIVSVALGGGPERHNLQPLCHGCNHIKRDRLDNAETRLVVAHRGLAHFMAAVCRQDTRYQQSFDRHDVATWAASNHERVTHARNLYAAFLDGSS